MPIVRNNTREIFLAKGINVNSNLNLPFYANEFFVYRLRNDYKDLMKRGLISTHDFKDPDFNTIDDYADKTEFLYRSIYKKIELTSNTYVDPDGTTWTLARLELPNRYVLIKNINPHNFIEKSTDIILSGLSANLNNGFYVRDIIQLANKLGYVPDMRDFQDEYNFDKRADRYNQKDIELSGNSNQTIYKYSLPGNGNINFYANDYEVDEEYIQSSYDKKDYFEDKEFDYQIENEDETTIEDESDLLFSDDFDNRIDIDNDIDDDVIDDNDVIDDDDLIEEIDNDNKVVKNIAKASLIVSLLNYFSKMRIKNINRVINKNGKTSDIIDAVMFAYEIENDDQIKALAFRLKGKNNFETSKNIHSYLLSEVNYKADSEGNNGEMIRTPARLLYDRVGDCKSYSLFTAVILRYLNIPHFFRFVSYNKKKQATHVYVVADNNIIIDAVATVQLGYKFNKEVKYTYRVDMSERGTKISYLAGLPAAKNAVGNINLSVKEIWTNNEIEGEISPAKEFIYSTIDLLKNLINISSGDEKNRYLLELSLFYTLLYFFDYSAGDHFLFQKYAVEIAKNFNRGDLHTGIDETEFDLFYKKKIDEIKQLNSNCKPNDELLEIFKNELFESLEVPYLENIPATIGNSLSIKNAIKKAGLYFLYMFIPENELNKYPAVVAKKRKTQIKLYNLIHKIDIFHSAATVKSYIRSGIIEATGKTPEDYIKYILENNKKNKVGEITLATIYIIIQIVVALIGVLKMFFSSQKIDEAEYKTGAGDFSNELFNINQNSNNQTTKSKSFNLSSTALLSTGLLGVFLFKNLNKKKND